TSQKLVRVIGVEADQVAVRTKVTVEDWNKVTAALMAPVSAASTATEFVPTSSADFAVRVREIVDRFMRTDEFNVNSSTQTAQRVLGQLGDLQTKVESIDSNEQLNQTLNAALTSLREDQRLAVEGNFTKLLPWIDGLVL